MKCDTCKKDFPTLIRNTCISMPDLCSDCYHYLVNSTTVVGEE